jgi:hypothetical protein
MDFLLKMKGMMCIIHRKQALAGRGGADHPNLLFSQRISLGEFFIMKENGV